MKKIYLTILSFASFISFSQYVVDSVDLNQFWYDSTVIDNEIWQIGQTNKPYFDNEWVLVTDTTAMYDSLIDASVEMVVTRPAEFYGYAIDFEHKIDTDTNKAGGYFEINFDNDTMYYDYNGTTYATWWLRFKNNPQNNFYAENFTDSPSMEMITDSGHVVPLSSLSQNIVFYFTGNNIQFNGYNDTLFNDEIGFTGKYDNWKPVHIELLFMYGLKTQDQQDTLNFRFHFVSDSTSNNKNGWAIKNINTGYVGYGGLATNEGLNISVFPNPTNSEFRVNINNFENKNVKLNVLNIDGQIIKSFYKKSNIFNVSIEEFTPGLYFIECYIDDVKIGQSKIIKQ